MPRLFGTDGVRGQANAELTPELALTLSRAAVAVLAESAHAAGRSRNGAAPAGAASRPVVIVGRDPRASGEMLEAAVYAGLASAGADVVRVGVLPTPAVAFLVGDTGADFGVMLSASHNPMPDNGIKFFAAGGHKLPDELEDRIEVGIGVGSGERPVGADIGRIRELSDGAERYIGHLLSTCDTRLDGLRIAVDAANGAASLVAETTFRRAGAEVVAVHSEPDGLNINDGCGSTHLSAVQAAVAEHGADIGIALDGDADRCLAVTADGTVVDGDAIMAILALAMREAGTLTADTVVATVMSNLGLHHALREAGIRLVTTAVGDRYVLEELRAGGYALGGEQSGHIVLPAHATTGDGTLTALHLLARVAATGRSLAELAAVMRRAPQVLINVPVTDKSIVHQPEVQAVVDKHIAELGDSGRVLLRPSGTEPLIRVMVEAADEPTARKVAEDIAELARR